MDGHFWHPTCKIWVRKKQKPSAGGSSSQDPPLSRWHDTQDGKTVAGAKVANKVAQVPFRVVQDRQRVATTQEATMGSIIDLTVNDNENFEAEIIEISDDEMDSAEEEDTTCPICKFFLTSSIYFVSEFQR